MGLIISILIIPVIKKLYKLNREINGRWFAYLNALVRLLRRRKQNKTNRIVTHDVFRDNLRDAGVLPFAHEWVYDCPDQVLKFIEVLYLKIILRFNMVFTVHKV